MKRLSTELIYRILDANLNRATEGARVCEEVARFIINDRRLTAQFKNIRHQFFKLFNLSAREKFIKKRDSKQDVGRSLLRGELKRNDHQEIFYANMQRVKESMRVLEEFYKLIDVKVAIEFKKIRYQVYEIEKKVTLKLSTVSGIRQKKLLPRQSD